MTRLDLKVGELARRTGVSVRTLHHYDAIGLLRPSRRSAAGHRLYTVADLQRLLQIRALVQTGLALDEVARCLARRDVSPAQILLGQLERVRGQIAVAERLCQRLESLLARLAVAAEPTVGDLLETIEEMTMFETYYTPDQLAALEARRQALGDDTIRAVENEWPQLIGAVRAAMDAGTDPRAPEVRALAQRWHELVAMFTGGDGGIRSAAAALIDGEPAVQARTGLDPALFDYVRRASDPV